MIPDEAVEAALIYGCATHGYSSRDKEDLVSHIDWNAGCRIKIEQATK